MRATEFSTSQHDFCAMTDFSESPGFIRDQKGRLEIEYLPPYAPELNPVEYIWAHCKHHELPKDCPKTSGI